MFVLSFFLGLLILGFSACKQDIKKNFNTNNFGIQPYNSSSVKIIPAAERTAVYLPLLKNKSIGIVGNQASLVLETHLVDTLLELEVNVTKIFTPEHGFTGTFDAGEKIASDNDGSHDIPIISLYGAARKPGSEDLNGIDLMVFDLQDVGVRFYTYISTLHYVMEACAEHNIPLVVLDRPNPNGFYVDGPILEPKFKTFVGMHPVPVVYGLTIGEYATMINGEGWLKNGIKCELEVIKCLNYDHTMTYELPVKPSPNLPNLTSILLYPSLCFFEGTVVSIGRGTNKQFQVLGHPSLSSKSFEFTPQSMEGAKNPKLENIRCYGDDFSSLSVIDLKNNPGVNIDWLVSYYYEFKKLGEPFFIENRHFNRLAGSARLKEQIISGKSAEEIRQSWKPGLEKYKEVRKKYLLYPE